VKQNQFSQNHVIVCQTKHNLEADSLQHVKQQCSPGGDTMSLLCVCGTW